MITPRFKLEQTEETIVIQILAPYTDIKQTEIHVLEDDFRFYSAPYYLRLNLPGKVQEGEHSSAKYNAESHSFIVTLDKINPGEMFPNLDMMTAMLQPKVDTPSVASPLIEIMSSKYAPTFPPFIHEQCLNGSSGNCEMEPVQIDCNDWFIHQVLDEEVPAAQLLQQYKYGFGSRHSGLGTKYSVELAEVAEIKDPDSMSQNQRLALQEEAEDDRFSDDHYFQDLMVTDFSAFVNYKLDMSRFQELDNSDRDKLKNFVNQEFLFDKTEQMQLFLGVVDILFAYLYDLRINCGKTCIESQWNVSRLSSTLSFFVVFSNMDSMVRSCIRKSLSFPLYRYWDLSLAVLKDTHAIIAGGNLPILKCFLGMQKLFSKRDPFYLLNQLYINEYCVWIQQVTLNNWHSLADGLSVAICKVRKADVGFDLYYLDIAAQATVDEAMEEEMSQQISGIAITEGNQECSREGDEDE